MAKVSLNQAAKDTEVSLPTLSRWRKAGKITAEKTSSGGYLIDTAEYDRILELRKQSPNMKHIVKEGMKNNATPVETELLRFQLEGMEQRLRDREIVMSDLRQERDDWKQQAQTLLLQHQTPQENVNNNSKIHDDIPSSTSLFHTPLIGHILLLLIIGLLIGYLLPYGII